MGHEFIGIVEAVGGAVRTVKTRRSRRRAVRMVGRDLRVLSERIADLLRARRVVG